MITDSAPSKLAPLADFATRFGTVDEIIDALIEMGSIRMIEPGMVELDHALQCAAELRLIRPNDLELQVAGLVHDICHGRCHIRDHGEAGSEAVRDVFGTRVAELVRLHIDAKRYLVAVDQTYRSKLSAVSIETLALQGGGLSPGQIAAFEASPYAEDACLLRIADEAAKVAGREVPGLATWIETLKSVARTAQ
jgi:predicted HD phosphohydrolase